MSAMSTAYDLLVTRLDAALPAASGYTRIPNPYNLGENDQNILRQGYGLALGPANNAKSELSCNMQIQRIFNVVVAREFLKLEHDVDGGQDVDKALMEDMRLVLRDFETYTSLNSGNVIMGYDSDGGIELLKAESRSFLFLRAQFTMKYFERLT